MDAAQGRAVAARRVHRPRAGAVRHADRVHGALPVGARRPRGAPGRVPRLGRQGRAEHQAVPGVARLPRRRGAHLHAGRGLERHRGARRDPQAVGPLEGRQPRQAAGHQHPDDGRQRARAGRRHGGLAAAGRGLRRVRQALPEVRPASGRGGRQGRDHRPRLGDERHHLQRALPPRPGRLEGVLAAHRHHDAVGPRHLAALRLHRHARPGRHPLARLLSGRRRGGHHRLRLLRPAGRKVLRLLHQRTLRPQSARRVRRRARKADVVSRVGAVPQWRQPRLCAGNA